MKLFFGRMIRGKAIGAQKNFAADFERVKAILENVEGVGDIEIDKGNPEYWRIKITPQGYQSGSGGSGGIPEGYEEETLNIITDSGIVTRKVLVETESKASVETFGSSDSRLLLSINTSGFVRKSKGYLKE